MKSPLALVIWFAMAGAAYAAQCIAPPVLTLPKTCTVGPAGGSCSFGYDEDGVVRFPPDQIVNGQVTITGGRNVHLIGGHVVAPVGANYAVAFNYPTNIFVEGMHIDANGQEDAFAIRNHRLHQLDVTFQNVYAEGPAYNVVSSGAHGDLIQYQGSWPDYTAGGFSLHIENFVGVTNGQGIFIPWREQTGSASADLRNVYIRTVPNSTYSLPLLWFWSFQYDPDGKPYPATLENVWVDYDGAGPKLYPNNGTNSAGSYDFEEPLITGIVNLWEPDGSDLNYPANVGLNYSRSAFCDSATPPEPVPDPEPVPELVAEPEPDTIAPAIEFWGELPQFAQRNSVVQIEPMANDYGSGIAGIKIYVDGKKIAEGTGDTLTANFKLKGKVGAVYNITASATDNAGNEALAHATIESTW